MAQNITKPHKTLSNHFKILKYQTQTYASAQNIQIVTQLWIKDQIYLLTSNIPISLNASESHLDIPNTTRLCK